jgi:hypothetical protein
MSTLQPGNGVLLALFALLLGGCAATPGHEPAKVAQEMSEAAITPLNDLNLVHSEIPPILKAARKGPYARPADTGCAAVASEITALEEVLEPDVDATKPNHKPTLVQRGAVAIEDAAVGMVRDTTSVIPFRDWVRKLSGAERNSKDVASAISAGNLRRAYLKGMASAGGCTLPVVSERPAEAANTVLVEGAWPP